MISSVRGTVLALHLDGVVIEVGGVGLRVSSTPSALADLRHGSEALLHTSLIVREDSLTLFGFPLADERDVFETLLGVSGVGPRLALAALAVHSPEDLRRAVAGNDVKALVRVPGIGTKGAQRIILELADKLGAPSTAVTGAAATSAPAASRTSPSAPPSPVVEALVGLGWSVKQAEDAVVAVLGEGAPGSSGADVPAAELPALLRSALRHLGRH